MELKEKIREVRFRLSLSQSVFGALIGVKQVSVSGYETGDRVPPFKKLEAIEALIVKHKLKIKLIGD